MQKISKENDPVKLDDLRVSYKILRNEITRERRNSKKDYYAAYFEKNMKKSSAIWKGIRNLVNVKKSSSSQMKLRDQNGNLINDPERIANIFNNHFSTIGHKVQQKILKL